jgi:hypothetical protein
MTATRDCTCLGHFGWCDTEKDHIHYFSHLAKRWKIGGPLLNFSLGICGLIFFGQMREVSPTQGDQGDYIQHNIAGVIVCDIAKASPM